MSEAAFFSLLTVEARHTAWALHIVGAQPVPVAFDKPRTLDSVAGTITRTHFISNRPTVSSRRSRPRYTG